MTFRTRRSVPLHIVPFARATDMQQRPSRKKHALAVIHALACLYFTTSELLPELQRTMMQQRRPSLSAHEQDTPQKQPQNQFRAHTFFSVFLPLRRYVSQVIVVLPGIMSLALTAQRNDQMACPGLGGSRTAPEKARTMPLYVSPAPCVSLFGNSRSSPVRATVSPGSSQCSL